MSPHSPPIAGHLLSVHCSAFHTSHSSHRPFWSFSSFLHALFATPLVPLLLAVIAHADPLPTAQTLCDAYPNLLKYDTASNAVLWNDGAHVPFGAERPNLTYDERLATATLFDQLSVPYPREWPQSPPPMNSDPGRMRCDAFFKKMYGDTAASVERNLVRVPWPAAGGKKTVLFTKVNRANEALDAVGAELAKLPENVRRYVAHPNGAFNWRTIQGTTRLSPHSYGIAIDFDMPGIANEYWRWNSHGEGTRGKGEAPSEPPTSESTYPTAILNNAALRQIVETFERHGFIWGGKWFHYDLMHFEFRPELCESDSSKTTERLVLQECNVLG